MKMLLTKMSLAKVIKIYCATACTSKVILKVLGASGSPWRTSKFKINMMGGN